MKAVIGLLVIGAVIAGGLFLLLSAPAHDRATPVGNVPPGSGVAHAAAAGAQESAAEPMGERLSRRSRMLRAGGVDTEGNFFGEVRDWARKDPEAALAWAQLQPGTDPIREEALTDACFQIAQTDPKRAVMLAGHFKLNRDSVLQPLAQQWAAQDLPAACAWVAEQPDDDQRNALATGVTFIWSQTEPASAVQYVLNQMTPGSSQDAAVLMVLHQWATKDPAGATAWVEQFPPGPMRDLAADELAGMARHPAEGAP